MTTKIMTPYGPITLGLHSAIDWVLVAIGAVGPFALGFTDQVWPTVYTYGVVGVGLLLNAATAYPGGLAKLLPMKWHQFIEWTSPGPFIIAPWLLFGSHPATWLLTGIGVAVVLNTALTQKAKIGSRQLNTNSGSSSVP
jgi:hypothetical protein